MSDRLDNDKEQDNEQGAVHIDIKSVRRNERSIRVMKRLIAFLVVILVGIGIYVSYPYWLPKLEGIFDKPATTIDNSGKVEDGSFPIAVEDAAYNVYAMKNNLAAADQHRLSIYDENGKRRGSYDHNLSYPVVKTSGKRALVFDFGGTGFKLYNKNGEIYSKSAENDIMTAALGENGTSALITSSDRYASSVLYYNKEGKLIYRYDSMKKVMGVYVAPDGQSSYVCVFSTDSGAVYSQVIKLDLGKDGEQMESEEFDCLAMDCMLCSDGNIHVAGDSAMFIITAEGAVSAKYEYGGDLIDFSLSRKCSAVTIGGNPRNSGTLVIAEAGASESETFREIEIRDVIKQVSVTDDRVLLLTSSAVTAYDYSSTVAGTAPLEKEYYEFVYINGSLYLSGKHGIDKIGFEM